MLKRLAVPILLFLVPACGGSSDPQVLLDEGSQALNSGEYEEAAGLYADALDAIGNDPTKPEWKRAKLGWILAQARIDSKKAKDEFLLVAASHPMQFTDQEFNLVGSRLGDANQLTEAIDVLTVGLAAHPESVHLAALRNDLGKKAEASGDPSQLNALKGLGYVGGD